METLPLHLIINGDTRTLLTHWLPCTYQTARLSAIILEDEKVKAWWISVRQPQTSPFPTQIHVSYCSLPWKAQKKHENPVRHLHDSWRETPKNSCHIHIQDADLRSLLQASEHTQAARTYQKWDPWHWTDLGNDPFRDTVESEMILWISELIWRTLHFLSPSRRHIVAAVLQRWAGKTSKKLHS